MLDMSNKIIPQFCAICQREKQPTNGISKPVGTPLFQITTTSTTISLRHKYGNLPSKKHDDLTQVTEPQWLRRGNLKESDSVCKRHLAILMRGVDRGCEGGCSSPLHRGARLCKSESLKSIPPTWRRRFMHHPKIKDEDKELMLFCWDCYKKHMTRMSKYGDPMGRSFGNKTGLQRSNSLIDAVENGTGILQAMKKYKSMEKLDSRSLSISSISPTNSVGSSPRRKSSSSTLQNFNGETTTILEIEETIETRSSPSRRTNRGRRSLKGKRSPSPPNNISPVRTSVVHSKRKHSPHKSPKSSSSRRNHATPTTSSPVELNVLTDSPNLDEIRHAPRLSVDEGALADTESPRSAPDSSAALLPSELGTNNEVFDVFSGSRFTASTMETSKYKNNKQECSDAEQVESQTTMSHVELHSEENVVVSVRTTNSREFNGSGVEYDTKMEDLNMITQQTGTSSIKQAEESTTSADEMADIFNNIIEESSAVSDENGPQIELETDTVHIPLPVFDDLTTQISSSLTIDHQHESSSGSSSDKTGVTAIENDAYKNSEESPSSNSFFVEKSANADAHNPTVFHRDLNKKNYNNVDEIKSFKVDGTDNAENVETKIPDVDSSIDSLDRMKSPVFLSPINGVNVETSPTQRNPTLSYSLSPQSFRKLAASTLEFFDESPSATNVEQIQRSKLFFRDDVRDKCNPMRSNVLMRVPRDIRFGNHVSSYIRIPAEDVEIFPDTMSFLESITQTVGQDMSMYTNGGAQISRVDLKVKDNETRHRTLEYSDNLLVLRRGQAFEIEIELNEIYEESHHNIMVELLIGDSPKVSNNTHIFLPVQRSNTPSSGKYTNSNSNNNNWSVRLIESREKVIRLSMTSPSTCPIGIYNLCFQIEKDGLRSRWNCGTDDDRTLVVLFNTWCIDDAVFMSSHSDRSEYVTSDTGCIYSGNQSNLISIPWIFGQYETGVLQACIDLLESCNLSTVKRGDPVSVARAIAQRITEIITGISLNKAQTMFVNGSAILKNFAKTGGLHLSTDNLSTTAILVTVFRCLGLPARPVTGLNCAVETDIPMSVNIHYNNEGYALDYLNNDKMWPSYSWVGVWMSRVDLPPGFGGWQAIIPHQIDVGPIPVYGIKKGQTSCSAGTQEHFSALNAVKKHWVVSQDGGMNLIKVEDKHSECGSTIFTKSVGNMEPQDVTKLYKFNKGCEEQKLAVHTAHMHCGRQNNCWDGKLKNENILMTLSTNPSVVNFGNDVDVITKITNNNDSVRHLTVNLYGSVVGEDGMKITKLQKETILAEVMANESVDVPVKFNLGPCLHKLNPAHHLVFTGFATIREEEERYVLATHHVGIKYPEIEIQVHGEFKDGGELTIVSRIRNPLPNILHNARLNLTTSGLTALDFTSSSGKAVGPWQVLKTERLYRCQRSGQHTIICSFTSDHMTGPMGIQEINTK